MFMHKSKKGFTIVELVIVIAVIAILAAVLIPTFSNLVKKANIANDTALAKNLNTALVAAEATDGKPTDFSKVLSALRADGYIVENLNPTTAGHFFVWESASNQILLVDENYKVVYSSKDLADANDTINPSWFFAVKSEALIADITANSGSVIPAVDTAWVGTDGQKIKDILADGGVVTLNESITLATAPVHPDYSDRADGIRIRDGKETTLNLAGQTLTGDFETYNYRMFQVYDGTLNLTEGNIVATAKLKDNGGLSLYGVVMIGGNDSTSKPVANISDVTLTFTGAETLDADDGGSVIMINDKNGVLTLEDSTIVATTAVGVYCDKGKATLNNVTVKSTGEFAHITTCLAVGHGGTMDIKSGTYSAQDAVIYVYPSGGTVNISGGVFSGKLKTGTQPNAVADSVINITGGTFTTVNGETKAFSSLTEKEWKDLCGNVDGLSVTGEGTNTVTLKVAK